MHTFDLAMAFKNLLIMLLLISIPLFLSASRKAVIGEGLLIVFTCIYLVVNELSWRYFLCIKDEWTGEEDIFSYSLSPLLPAISFYGGIFFILLMIAGVIRVFRNNVYTVRQKMFFSSSASFAILAAVIALRIPIWIQHQLDITHQYYNY